jgi:hypothetical protein
MMKFREFKPGALCSLRRLFAFGLFAVWGTLSLPAVSWSQGTVNQGESNSAAVLQESTTSAETKALHEKLAKYLTGTRWEGQFSMSGVKGNQTETYEIIKAEKGAEGDNWNLIARIKYGGKDATLPLPPIEIKFAGGTPVITVDRVTFPGFGTFDARVLIRQGQYAGTWAHLGQGGGVGGHLFGTIKKMDESELKQKLDRSSRKQKAEEK